MNKLTDLPYQEIPRNLNRKLSTRKSLIYQNYYNKEEKKNKYVTLKGKHVFCATEGDFRMVLGEDKSKVANIVQDSTEHFRILYSNILRDCPQVVYKPQQGKLEVKQATHMHTTHSSVSLAICAVHINLELVWCN